MSLNTASDREERRRLSSIAALNNMLANTSSSGRDVLPCSDKTSVFEFARYPTISLIHRPQDENVHGGILIGDKSIPIQPINNAYGIVLSDSDVIPVSNFSGASIAATGEWFTNASSANLAATSDALVISVGSDYPSEGIEFNYLPLNRYIRLVDGDFVLGSENVAFSALESMPAAKAQKPSDISRLIVFLKTGVARKIFSKIENRFDQLRANYLTEAREDISAESLATFASFLNLHPAIKPPGLTLSPNGDLIARWKQDNRTLLQLHFLEDAYVRYVCFLPEPKRKERTLRMSGTASTDSVLGVLRPDIDSLIIP